MTRGLLGVYLLLVVVTGCGITAPAPEDHFYRVQPDFPGAPEPVPRLGGQLLVDAVTADPLRSGRAVLFREEDKPLQLQRYHYAFWAERPPRMVQQVLSQYLRSSGIAESVQDGRSLRADPDYEIRARLLRFERIVGKTGSGVELELEVSFYIPGSEQVQTMVYEQRLAADGDDMHATANAMQEALGQVFAEILSDLEQFGLSG